MSNQFKGISKNPYYLFGLTFNSSPLERKRRVFRDALKLIVILCSKAHSAKKAWNAELVSIS